MKLPKWSSYSTSLGELLKLQARPIPNNITRVAGQVIKCRKILEETVLSLRPALQLNMNKILSTYPVDFPLSAFFEPAKGQHTLDPNSKP